ncbi:MAG: peptidylprolyl isomerase [Desulfosarcinaceae bacterium]
METNKGVITLSLDQEKAPKTVANFLAYVDKGFYDGTVFHRVIKGFMIQGGGLTPDMQPKPTDAPIVNEADNGLKNSIGTIAMARTSQPHSATSQFFINTANNVFLNHRAKTSQGWGYCVFGRVVDGMDVVHAIEQVRTGMRHGHKDVPVEPVVIKSMKRAPDQDPSIPPEGK